MSTSPSKRRKLDSPPAPPEGQLDFGGPPSLVSLPFPPSSSSQVKNVVAPDTVTFSLEGAASNGPAVGESMSKQQQMTVEEAATAARVEEGGGDEPYVFDEEEHEEKLKIWDLFAEEYHDGKSELSNKMKRRRCGSFLDFAHHVERVMDYGATGVDYDGKSGKSQLEDDEELWLMLSLFSA